MISFHISNGHKNKMRNDFTNILNDEIKTN